MFVELHILQNFSPSNLNRDDTGAPKDCEFGGHRRARISSQCLKRAMRTHFRARKLLPEENLSERTKRLVEAVRDALVRRGRPAEAAESVATRALQSVKLATKEESKTEYLLFLGRTEIDALIAACDAHWDALVGTGAPQALSPVDPLAAKQKSPRKKKADDAGSVPPDVKKAVDAIFDPSKAADIALFGRMLADMPEHNVDAASQVAHALSTNRVSMEFDYYTAVDDRKPVDTAGADMIGTVDFNSACYYRYSNVDVVQLTENLGGDDALASKTVEAFLRGAIEAVPTGKQNSMAAQNPPSLVFAVVRESGLCSLSNAFVQPIHADREGDLITKSIRALDKYWHDVTAAFGLAPLAASCMSDRGNVLDHLKEAYVPTVTALIDKTVRAAFGRTFPKAGA